MTNIVNVHADYDGHRASLGCEADGFRYHIWVDPRTLEHNGTLYKNPPAGITYRQPGYFHTRMLDPAAKSNADIMKAMLENARALVDAARQKWAEEQRAAHAKAIEDERRGNLVAHFAKDPDGLLAAIDAVLERHGDDTEALRRLRDLRDGFKGYRMDPVGGRS